MIDSWAVEQPWPVARFISIWILVYLLTSGLGVLYFPIKMLWVFCQGVFSIFFHAQLNILFGRAAAIEKDLWATGTVNEEYLKSLNALFSNFPRLRATEPATLSIPHLVTSLKTGSEASQEAALDALFLLRQAWSACPAEVSRAQSIAAADAIPLLQYLIQSGPPRFQEKAEFLLQCLPGTLVVIIKRGNNMKQSVGNPSVYCKLTLGNTPPRQTKVRCIYTSSCLFFVMFYISNYHLFLRKNKINKR